MTARTRFVRRLGAALAATALLLLLVLAWNLRPALTPLPHVFSQPVPGDTISGILDLAAWAVAILLDLVLLGKVIQFAICSKPTRTELRLRQAFAQHRNPSIARTHDWRAHAAPLAPPVLRLPIQNDLVSELTTTVEPQQPIPAKRLPDHPEVSALAADDRRDGVRLLGPLELIGCKKKRPRRQATADLIAYLAVEGRRLSRDELLEALWPGDDPGRSAARFYQAATEARRLLGDAFQRDRDMYTLDHRQLRIDVDELDEIRQQGETGSEDEQRAAVERALKLFRGDPLVGIDALWADAEARRLTAIRVELLERLALMRLKAGDPVGALDAAQTAHAHDPTNERPSRVAMEAEAALGRREAVIERYESLCRLLDERLGLEPSRETKQLYRSLLSQDAVSA
jgi:DNA-binding SARP family transcriptional activator